MCHYFFTPFLYLPSGSPHDRERGSDFTHGAAEGGAEAHAWLSSPEVDQQV